MLVLKRGLRFVASPALLAVFVVASTCRGDITDGLIHYWPFDEMGGVTAHDAVGGNDGLLVNWSLVEPRWVTGKQGNALDFGSDPMGDDNVVVTTGPIVSDEYTISFFLQTRFDPEKVNSRIIGPTSHYWLVVNQESGKGVGFYYDHGNSTLQDSSPPVIGEWEHYALTVDRTTRRSTVFRDGFPVATGLVPNYVKDYPAGPWSFGHPGDPATHDGRDALSGLLDEIRIYNRILSPDEVIVLSGIAASGDFDGNDILDVRDIDALTQAVRSGQNPAEYDINADGTVDQEDRLVWVVERKGTFFGDANLDRRFDTSDLVHVFIRGQYEKSSIANASWQDGDWNGDGLFDSSDMIAAFVAGGYEHGPRTVVATVPEPMGWLLWLIGLPVLLFHRRTCRIA